MQTQQSHNRDKSEPLRSLGKPVGAFEARRTFGRLIEEAYYQKDAFVVERSGRPMAVIVSVDEYQRLKQLAKDTLFQMVSEVWERTKDVPPEELAHDVDKAIAMLHEEQKRSPVTIK